MSTRSIYIAFIFNLFSFQGICQGNEQTQDSLIIQYQDTLKKQNIFHRIYKYFQESNETTKEKKFDFSIIGGPHFASDVKLGLGLVAPDFTCWEYGAIQFSPMQTIGWMQIYISFHFPVNIGESDMKTAGRSTTTQNTKEKKYRSNWIS